MTIPTLVANYNTKSWNTAATVFDRKLEEALKTMNTQSTLAGHATTESFVEELSKHFKTNKICSNDKLLDCFSETVYWGGGDATPEEVDMSKIKVAKDFGQDDWNTNIVGVQFANGVSAMIAYNPISCTQDPYSNRVTGGDCLAILYDTSGAKNPNTSSKDLRANGNVSKLGSSGAAFEINGVGYGVPFYPTAHTWIACTTNGTSENAEDIEFMRKHGIDYCMSPDYGTEDYWAGAVAACGGKSKMPSMAQLAELANYLYGTTGIGTDTPFECPNDTNCRIEANLGFADSSGEEAFDVWSNEDYSSLGASWRGFGPGASYPETGTYYRDIPDIQAVCIL